MLELVQELIRLKLDNVGGNVCVVKSKTGLNIREVPWLGPRGFVANFCDRAEIIYDIGNGWSHVRILRRANNGSYVEIGTGYCLNKFLKGYIKLSSRSKKKMEVIGIRDIDVVMKALEESKLQPYTDEERVACEEAIAKVLKRRKEERLEASRQFIQEFNKNKVSDEFLESCAKAGRLFGGETTK